MKKGIVALALGTFALGMTEYVMMSILPDLATAFNCNIATAGHLISAYALGVCVGAPLVAIFMRNMKLQHILLWLMAIYTVGNCLFALSGNLYMGIAARFITGLPHGAFFGTGSIVASRLMPSKATTAVALMTLGMTVANLAGVPAGSYIANTFSWHWIFAFNALCGIITFATIAYALRDSGALPRSNVKGIFHFLRSAAPWLLIAATVLCQGGAFAMYSYVSPIITHSGLAIKYMPVFMIIVGLGMCVGNYYSGILSDRTSPTYIVMCVAVLMTISLAATYFDNSSLWLSGFTIVIAATCLFALSSPMQLLLIEYSPGGELMGGAMVQVAFNLGNAVGAYLGGLPINAGKSPESASIVGAALAALSIAVVLIFTKHYKSSKHQNSDFV